MSKKKDEKFWSVTRFRIFCVLLGLVLIGIAIVYSWGLEEVIKNFFDLLFLFFGMAGLCLLIIGTLYSGDNLFTGDK